MLSGKTNFFTETRLGKDSSEKISFFKDRRDFPVPQADVYPSGQIDEKKQ